MAQPSFSSILDRQATSIERPPLTPMGTYLTVVKGLPRMDKSSKKQTPFSEFTCQIIAAQEDVDADELEAFLNRPDGSKRALSEQVLKPIYYHTENSAFMLTKFLEDCGIDLEDKSVGQAQNEVPNCQVYLHVKHEPLQSGEGFIAKVSASARVD